MGAYVGALLTHWYIDLLVNSFYSTDVFLYPLRISENPWFCVFRGFRMRPVAWEGLIPKKNSLKGIALYKVLDYKETIVPVNDKTQADGPQSETVLEIVAEYCMNVALPLSLSVSLSLIIMKLHLTTSKDLGLANVRKIKTCKKKPKTNEIGIYGLIHHVDEPDLFHLIQELSYNYFQTFIWGGLIILIFVCVSSTM